MPSGKLRQALRGHGHRLSAIVQVGKAGITPGLVKQLEQALTDHELVKIKVAAESPEDRFAVTDQLAALPDVNIVQLVGRVVLLYKRRPVTPRYDAEGALIVPVSKTQPAPLATKTKEKIKADSKEEKRRRRGPEKGKRGARDRAKDAQRSLRRGQGG